MAKLDISIPNMRLPDGHEIPMLGFGTGSAWCAVGTDKKNQELVAAAKTAIDLGYHHLDSAEAFDTEVELGKAIKDSGVSRESLFVTSKCTSVLSNVEEHLDNSLKKLGLQFVDLYLLQSPWEARGDRAILQNAWSQMEALQASGKAKSIGVSNFSREHIDAILETAQARPAINQIEFHPYLQLEDLVAFHKNKDIRLAGFGTLTPEVKVKDGPLTPLLNKLARKYAVAPREILLRWVLDQNVAVITTSSEEQRLSDMLRVVTFQLTPREHETVTETGKEFHFRAWYTEHFDDQQRS